MMRILQEKKEKKLLHKESKALKRFTWFDNFVIMQTRL